jgi:hypothetical protein
MSDNNDEKKNDEQRPLGAVLGWLNLSPTLPNNQDNIAGLTAGSIGNKISSFLKEILLFSITTKIY